MLRSYRISIIILAKAYRNNIWGEVYSDYTVYDKIIDYTGSKALEEVKIFKVYRKRSFRLRVWFS